MLSLGQVSENQASGSTTLVKLAGKPSSKAKFQQMSLSKGLKALNLSDTSAPAALPSPVDISKLNVSYNATIPDDSQEVHAWALSVFTSVQSSNDIQVEDSERKMLTPKLTNSEGINGSYFIRQNVDGEWKIVGIFKPLDEAVGAPNALKVGSIVASKHGIKPGTEGNREVWAWILGKALGVPPTVLLTLGSPVFVRRVKDTPQNKPGSLQQFVPDARDFHRIPQKELDEIIPKIRHSETHRIAILDLKLANTDRNKGNLLLSETDGVYTLHPIDHGCILSQKFVDAAAPYWAEFPGADTSFTPKEKEFIAAIDIEKDIEEIRKSFPSFSTEDEYTLRIATMILQEGARQDLSPLEILALYKQFADYSQPLAPRIYLKAESSSSSKEEFLGLAKLYVERAVSLVRSFSDNEPDVKKAMQNFREYYLMNEHSRDDRSITFFDHYLETGLPPVSLIN